MILISRLLPLSVTTYYMFTRLIHVVIHWFCMLSAVNFVMHTDLVTALEICDFTLCYVYSLVICHNLCILNGMLSYLGLLRVVICKFHIFHAYFDFDL